MDFLPINIDDMKKRGWEECDFVFVTGDAYVDHSSFAASVLSRLLERFGYNPPLKYWESQGWHSL